MKFVLLSLDYLQRGTSPVKYLVKNFFFRHPQITEEKTSPRTATHRNAPKNPVRSEIPSRIGFRDATKFQHFPSSRDPKTQSKNNRLMTHEKQQ
jgi:hypothetical protein